MLGWKTNRNSSNESIYVLNIYYIKKYNFICYKINFKTQEQLICSYAKNEIEINQMLIDLKETNSKK